MCMEKRAAHSCEDDRSLRVLFWFIVGAQYHTKKRRMIMMMMVDLRPPEPAVTFCDYQAGKVLLCGGSRYGS